MSMRIAKMAVLTVALVGILVLGLAGVGWWLFGRGIWGGVAQAQGSQNNGWTCPAFGSGDGTTPGGMMGGYGGGQTTPQGPALTLEQAKAAVEQYIAGDANLAVDEVMEFNRNFYALVKEQDTGLGAMELLVNKQSGAIFPEYGPNMMWNTKYGMMAGYGGGMMGGRGGNRSGAMAVTPAEALQIAQRWLDANRPGVTTEAQADQFYGYYTVHTLKDDKINGMLSVDGYAGQVWYHTWHGEFIDILGGESGSL